MNAIEHFNKNKKIYFLITIFLIAQFFTISYYKEVWWDAAVYVGMGKYVYSNGNSGLWEESRPVVWPLILGFIWKVGLNTILIGRLLEILIGGLCILLTYSICKKLFNEKTALLASILLALSPTFFFFSGIMLTETVSAFFALTAIYSLISKRHFISGFFFGLSFTTRFLQLFTFISLVLVYSMHNKQNVKNFKKIIIGFAITLLPYLILNFTLYNNSIYPFTHQILLTQNSGWFAYQPLSFYFMQLFNENILYLLGFAGMFLMLRNKDTNKKLIAAAFLLLFIFFNLMKQKEMRFLIILMPYLYILISVSIFYIINKFKNKYLRTAIYGIMAISLVFSIISIPSYYKIEANKPSQYSALQERFKEAYGNIWISNPVISAFSDKKISNIMYYPFFNNDKKEELIRDSSKADFIFMDSCDLACRPKDNLCEEDKKELITYFKNNNKIDYSSVIYGCEQYIFKKTIFLS